MRRSRQKHVEALAEEAFAAAEHHQGHGFISDSLDVMGTPERLFETVRGHLWHSEQACKSIRAFLRKHGELPARTGKDKG